jgi:ribulose-phosphate 3-epimerase
MSYFRYKNFKFTDLQVETICNELHKNVLEYEVSEQGLSDNRLGYEFSASMIEVPFDDEYKKLTEMLWNEGIRHFHIDVGDGKFISRTFSGLDKAKYLKEKYPESTLHCHLMVENPHFSHYGRLSPIKQYINAGCEAIAIHRNSFTKQKYLLSALELIKNCGARPGLIIEITESFDGKLQDLIVEYDLDWVVIMGVAIGYGGQIFKMSSLKTVISFTQYAKKTDKPFLIEMDGGLTMENIELCKHAGAQILSGWSVIKGNTIEETRDKVRTIRKLLS